MQDNVDITVTEAGQLALEKLTRNEIKVLTCLFKSLKSGEITSYSTQKELSENIPMHVNSVSRAYKLLFDMKVIVSAGHGRTLINPKCFFAGPSFVASNHIKKFDEQWSVKTEEASHRRCVMNNRPFIIKEEQ